MRLEQKNDWSRAERRGEGRDLFSLHKARKKDRFGLDRQIWFRDLDYAQNRWDGCFGAATAKPAPPVDPSDPSRMPRMTAWPGNNEDTDVQPRDCARFKSTGVSEVPSRVNGGADRVWGRICLLEWQGRGRRY